VKRGLSYLGACLSIERLLLNPFNLRTVRFRVNQASAKRDPEVVLKTSFGQAPAAA